MTSFTRPGLERLLAKISEITLEVGTPLYVYDWDSINFSLNYILSSINKSSLGNNSNIYLAFFALPNIRLFQKIMRLDNRLGITCNSIEEIIAFKNIGFNDWERVVFSGGVLPEKDLMFIAETGCLINVASLCNLEKMLDKTCSARVGLRIDMENKALKGLSPDELEYYFHKSEDKFKRLSALHSYLGTEINNLEFLIRHAEALISIAAKYNNIKEINFGGGFNYNYLHKNGNFTEMVDFPKYFNKVKELVLPLIKERDLKLIWEPGRIVFAGSGFFVTEVIEVRQKSVMAADIYVDASFTNIPALKIRNRQHLVAVIDSKGRIKEGLKYNARLCGPTTLSTDQLMTTAIPMPYVEPGDMIIIFDAGAYGRAGSYNFLGKANPPEVLLLNDGFKIIRRRQRMDHILEGLDES
jgi:diaminopimelate decarboxylase